MSADPWEEAVAKARKAIYDDGRGMIGRNRNYLQDRVARAILAERKEAADVLASKEEEIAALRLFVAQCDALFEAMQADAAFIFPNKFGSLATYRAVARSLQGDADVSRGGGE